MPSTRRWIAFGRKRGQRLRVATEPAAALIWCLDELLYQCWLVRYRHQDGRGFDGRTSQPRNTPRWRAQQQSKSLQPAPKTLLRGSLRRCLNVNGDVRDVDPVATSPWICHHVIAADRKKRPVARAKIGSGLCRCGQSGRSVSESRSKAAYVRSRLAPPSAPSGRRDLRSDAPARARYRIRPQAHAG